MEFRATTYPLIGARFGRSDYVLTRDTQPLDDAVEDAVQGTVGEELIRVVQSDDPDEAGLIRPFVVIDLRRALRAVRQRDASLPAVGEAADAASELASTTDGQSESGSADDSGGGGRGLLPSLFVAGVVVGLGYALRRRRSGRSPEDATEEAAEDAAEETRTIAERAASTIQQRGEMAATRIEAGTGAVAERIEERGDEVAGQIEESEEQLEEVESTAEEKVDEASSDAEEVGQGDEEPSSTDEE